MHALPCRPGKSVLGLTPSIGAEPVIRVNPYIWDAVSRQIDCEQNNPDFLGARLFPLRDVSCRACPKSLSDQFPVHVCSCPLCIINRL